MSDNFGSNSALRSTLKLVLDALTAEQKDYFLGLITMDIESLEDLWGRAESLSVLQKDFIDELKRIQFMIGESKNFLPGKKPGRDKHLLFCIDCKLPIINTGPDLTCPSCGKSKWLDLTRL